jgi:16S rRNA (guanine527-N7)-methyltransferase
MTATPTLPDDQPLWDKTLGWHPNAQQQQSFQRLYHALLGANQQVNLTRITTPEDFWEKHLWDSLQGVAPWLGENSLDPLQVVDIGTGGGFPGLPLAIVFPHWQLTLIDSTAKKMAAIATMLDALALPNVSLLTARAEQVAHRPAHREAYDLAVIRAVGSANTCAEYVLPLLKPGGRGVLYRGQWTAEEAASLQTVIPPLGGQWLGERSQTTPLSQGIRHNIDLLKVARTPDKFPRSPGIPAKTPLH